MHSSAVKTSDVVATDVKVTTAKLSVELSDGRTIVVPLSWYPRLQRATKKERSTWRFIAAGRGIHWPGVDEDISVANLLAGQRSAESGSSLKRWLAARGKREEHT
jgi:hypothetical protein